MNKTTTTLPLFMLLLYFCGMGVLHSEEHSSTSHWSYSGSSGPAQWASLAPANKACGEGNQQSPINIEAASRMGLQPVLPFPIYRPKPLRPLHFAYRFGEAGIINNGHTIQLNLKKAGTIRTGNQEYQLLQLDFHTPSEHKVQGLSYDMEVHFVHRNAQGKLAVVGVFVVQGRPNRGLGRFWNELPTAKGSERPLSRSTFHPLELLPARKSYFQYTGSLTTPPCSEGVQWYVLTTPIEASIAQIERFRSLISFNARPSQKLNKRVVTQYGRK